MKIFPKTFLYTLALLLLIALLANGIIYTLMPKVYIDQKQKELTGETDAFVKKLESASSQDDLVKLMSDYASSTQANLTINIGQNTYSLFSWDGGLITRSDTATVTAGTESTAGTGDASTYTTAVVVASSSDIAAADDYNTYNADKTAGVIISDNSKSSDKTISAKRSFTMNGEAGSFTAVVTLAPVDEAAGVILSLLPISLLLCVLIAIVFSVFYAKAITRPIELISSETVRMTALDKTASCEIKTKDEFGVLAENVNGLYKNLLSTIESLETELNKVGEAERKKTDFLRAASHELKTPVTAVSVIMENMMLGVGKYKNHDEWLPECKKLVDGLSEKLRDILDASQLESGSEEPTTKSIEELSSEILAPYVLIARAKGLSVYVDWSGAFEVIAPPKLLGRALSNVVSNAVQYSIPGSRFSVYCRGRSLIVENECEPLPSDQLKQIYEPFYRPDSSRSRETGGNGLGLYIVKTVLRILELDYSFEPISSPEGMRFTLNF